jgi:hypothetical protein
VVLTVVALIVLTQRVFARRTEPVTACALMTVAFLLSNKVYSPQYDLWLVPFLVMLPVPGRLVRHFYVATTTVFVLAHGLAPVVPRPAFLYLMGAAVTYRLCVLVAISVALLTPSRPRPAHGTTGSSPGARRSGRPV